VVGIRPGEKMHEIMCPADDSHLTLEFEDHYVIQPTIQFSKKRNYLLNALSEEGSAVEQGFEYNSNSNQAWLTHEHFLQLADKCLKDQAKSHDSLW
jgi:UDP-N-acetylglucosamine 4,6-dehydratase